MVASSSIPAWASRAVTAALTAVVSLFIVSSLHAQQASTLDTIRSDVHQGAPPSQPAQTPSPPASTASSPSSSASSDFLDELLGDATGEVLLGGAIVVGGAITSPFWAPHVLLNDDYSTTEYFPDYPYDHTPGYLVDPGAPVASRPSAFRLDADYVEAFDHLDLINGHILVSTASRFEFDARAQHLGEALPGGQEDTMWIGDCNAMFRYGQSSFAQFRAGVGINWLNSPGQTDLGFNFAYGIDVFPIEPVVLSTVLDAGTLGHAGMFRFRTTAGVLYRRVEFYTGYEYTDIGRTSWNGLIGGVRLWF